MSEHMGPPLLLQAPKRVESQMRGAEGETKGQQVHKQNKSTLS